MYILSFLLVRNLLQIDMRASWPI